MSRILPDFLIVGAPRSGTTLLYEVLSAHPDVFMSPIKEPGYFCNGKVRDLDDYLALFERAETHVISGEATTLYLYDKQAAGRIHEHNPRMNLVAVLRDPVERAYSHYLQHVVLGSNVDESFEQSLAGESARIVQGRSPFTYYRQLGCYGSQILRYLQHFPREQLLFLLHDDLKQNPAAICRRLFQFLGVNSDVAVRTGVNRNPSGMPKNKRLHRLLMEPGKGKGLLKQILPGALQRRIHLALLERNLSRPPLSDATRKMLIRFYRPEVEMTAELIGRDLSAWLSVSGSVGTPATAR